MKLLERILHALFPSLLLEGTPWGRVWEEKERREHITTLRYVFGLASLAYVGHYYLVDVPMGLEPRNLWFNYRMGLAALALAVCGLYFLHPIGESKAYRVPAYVACWAMAYWQARSMVWFEETLYLYGFAFVVVGAVILRTSPFNSLCFGVVTLSSQWPSFMATDVSRPLLYSAAAISLLFIYITRSKYADEVRHFLAVQQNLQSQKEVIELTIEFSDRIRALLPREISNRLTHYLSEQGLTVLQAMEEVLRPRKKRISCLYTDIRGFTQGTKDLDNFVGGGVIPNVKECTLPIEENHGIPRKIGDLIFAYFDHENPFINTLRSVYSGIKIVQYNDQFNRQNQRRVEIRRHVLISHGEAIVGNIGGFDSSIEITALGSPVNLLSRLDELTKRPALEPHLVNPCLMICSRTAENLNMMEIGVQVQRLDLKAMGLCIRDFDEVTEIWLMQVNSDNEAALRRALHAVEKRLA